MKVIRGFFGFINRHFFNFRRWTSYDFLKNSASQIYSSGKTVFHGPSIEKSESFEEALKRLHLSEKDLNLRYQNCQRIFWVFLILAIVLAIYTVYLIYHAIFMGAILALCVTSLVAMHAFKYHFWMFQIKNRKLGCTLQEWKANKTNNNNQ